MNQSFIADTTVRDDVLSGSLQTQSLGINASSGWMAGCGVFPGVSVGLQVLVSSQAVAKRCRLAPRHSLGC